MTDKKSFIETFRPARFYRPKRRECDTYGNGKQAKEVIDPDDPRFWQQAAFKEAENER